MKTPGVPAPAVKRISLYLRELEVFQRAKKDTISSKQLGQALGLTDAQIRKDLAYFGQFGMPGVGYRVDDLIDRVRRILGTDRLWPVALVGLGNLGRALGAYGGFRKKNFRISAVFDADPDKIGQIVAGPDELRVQPMSELESTVRRLGIRIAAVAVPADAAQDVVEQLAAVGIKGILNFAPVSLAAPAGVALISVDLAVELEQLSFLLTLRGKRLA